jgi:hypothetical protein
LTSGCASSYSVHERPFLVELKNASVEEFVVEGNYETADPRYVSANFPLERDQGARELIALEFEGDNYPTHAELDTWVRERGYRYATLKELLAATTQCADFIGQTVANGTSWRDQDGKAWVPMGWCNDMQRTLILAAAKSPDEPITPWCWYLVTRETTRSK